MIACYRGMSFWPSQFTKLFTWGDYSHVSWICEDGSEYGAEMHGGVMHMPHWGDPTRHNVGTEIDLYDFVIPLTKDEVMRLEYFFEQECGKAYDWTGVFAFMWFLRLIGIGRNNDARWFCSELFAAGCEYIGRFLFCKKPPYKISPSDVPTSPILKYIQTIKIPPRINCIDTNKLPIEFV